MGWWFWYQRTPKILSKRDFFKELSHSEDESPSFIGKWEQMDCARSNSEWIVETVFLATI